MGNLRITSLAARTIREPFRRLHRDLLGRRDTLLHEFKSKWPDNTYKKDAPSLQAAEMSISHPWSLNYLTGGEIRAFAFLKGFRQLKIGNSARILDIGAGDNSMVEELHNKGYKNSIGIDTEPLILRSRSGRQVNFRDLPLNETFDVICFSSILSYFEGSNDFQYLEKPTLQMLASKISCHLKPGGHVMFYDCESSSRFTAELEKLGFKQVQPPPYYDMEGWQKG